MPQQHITVGPHGGGQGDLWPEAFDKTEANFNDLYQQLAALGFSAEQITGLSEFIAAYLVAGSGISLTDNGDTLTIAATSSPTGATLVITEEDYAAPATVIYLGGLWSDDGRWQVSKFVAGVQTRATLLNNGAVTTLAAAWTARASLTYA